LFIALSMASRLLCGVAAGMFFTIILAIVSSNYADRLQMVIAYVQISLSLGFFAGPSIGSVFYYMGGYFAPFLAFSLYFALAVPAIYCLLGPDREYIEKNKTLKAKDLVKSRVRARQAIVLDAMNNGLMMFGVGALNPLITLHLMTYGLSNQAAGLLSVSNTLTFMIASPVVAKLASFVNRRLVMATGLIFLALAYYCIGPLSPLPDQLGCVLLGLGLLGCGFGLVYGEC
jgi:MFS family permease